MNAIIEQCGLTRAYLDNKDNWVSVEFSRDFTLRCNEAAGDPELQYKAGAYSISEEIIGRTAYSMLENFVQLRSFYLAISKLAPFVNRVLRFELCNKSTTSIDIKISIKSGALDDSELRALKEEMPFIVQNTSGWWAACPRLFKLPDANVTVTKPDPDNESCILRIEHEALAFGFFSSTVKGTFLGLALLILMSFFSQPVIAILGSLTGAFVYISSQQKNRIRVLRKLAQDTEQALEKVDAQYGELQSAKESLVRKFEESRLVNQILENLMRQNSLEGVMQRVCSDIAIQLNYDRVLFFSANTKKEQLEFAASYGISPDILPTFQKYTLPFHIESTNPTQLTNVFRFRKSLLVKNVAQHIDQLTEEGRSLMAISKTQSFLAVPIFSNSMSYGLIVVDCGQDGKSLSENDLNLMETVAKQIAISLDKEKAQSDAIQAYESANRLKDDFLARTSHELRTPLHGIIGLAESLCEDASVSQNRETLESLNLMISSGKRLSGLVDDILDFSVLNHKSLEINITTIDILSLVTSTTRVFETMAAHKGIQLKHSFPEVLPFVAADENRLHQILYNLVGNAVKFTESGSILISAKLNDGFVEVSVIDTGIGIDSTDINSIFDPFIQGETSKNRRYNGTGLGLSITRELVRLQGGDIWVSSKKGNGSTFTFSIPIAMGNVSRTIERGLKVQLTEDKSELTISLPDHESPPLTSETKAKCIGKILVVDDEIVNLQVLKSQLNRSAYDVITSASGSDALQKIKNGLTPDLILLDVMMPGMTGYEVCEVIRKDFTSAQMPIIFLTALKEEKDLLSALRIGANDYLSKPFSKNELLARIENLIHLTNLSKNYSRFVPWNTLEHLNYSSVLDIRLGDAVERSLTFLFTDIRNFTSFCQDLHPMEVMKFLNSYLEAIAPVIEKHQGGVDKFLGDGFMGIFNEPGNAILAAVEMTQALREYNQKNRSGGEREFIQCGIGIHGGSTVIGPVGYENRLDITALGDAVNTASRVESLTKIYGASILVSEEIFDTTNVISRVAHRKLGPVQVRGRTEELSLVEVFEGQNSALAEHKQNTKKAFESAVKLFIEGQFHDSLKIFSAIRPTNNIDLAIDLYITKLLTRLQESVKRAS